jgi:hypothetical protein
MFLFVFLGDIIDQTMAGKGVSCFSMPSNASEKNGIVLVAQLWP